MLTIDGIGEWATATIGHGISSRIDLLEEMRYPHSLGLLYSMATVWCGFEANEGEYKLMGLAPFGQPTYREALEQFVELSDDGAVGVDQRAVGGWSRRPERLGRLVELLDGPPRRTDEPLSQRDADLARSVQDLTEEAVRRMATHARHLTGERNLCLAGGVALNCVANGSLQRTGEWDGIWVQPAAGDAGSAVGAALWFWHSELGEDRTPTPGDAMSGAALGPAFSNEEIAAYLAGEGIASRRVDTPGALHDEVAARLAEGAIVGWFRGRMEFGPRALGHRSILADPRSPTVQRDLNLRVKGRESFRPFAPAVLAERASEWFEIGDVASPYMLFTYPVVAGRRLAVADEPDDLVARVQVPRSEIPACTHVDGSARVQTVAGDRSPDFHMLLSAFEDANRLPCAPQHLVQRRGRAGRVHAGRRRAHRATVRPGSSGARRPPGGACGPRGNGHVNAWIEAPELPPERGLPRILFELAAVVIAMAGPVATISTNDEDWRLWIVAAGTLGGAVLMGVLPERWWVARLAVAGAAAAVVLPAGGRFITGWALVGLVLGDYVARERRFGPLPLPPPDREVLAGVLVLQLVAANRSRLDVDMVLPSILVGASVGLALAASRVSGPMSRIAAAFGRGVAHVVATIVFGVLGVLVLVLPWGIHRLVGFDPLGVDMGRHGRWARRARRDVRVAEMWADETALDPLPAGARCRRMAVVPLSLAIVVVGYWVFANFGWLRELGTDPTDLPVPGAYQDDIADTGRRWYDDLQRDFESFYWAAYNPARTPPLRDFRSETVNVEGAARRTWRAPECGCRRLKVWIYGGSTTFGQGQRDEHTIASELARVAAAKGVTVDVTNRGVLGEQQWIEGERFGRDLAFGDDRPDLVVFYDGVNEVMAAARRSELGFPTALVPWDPITEPLAARYEEEARTRVDPFDAPGGASRVTSTTEPQVGPEEIGRSAVDVYDASRATARALAEAEGLPVIWFWQPSRWSRPPVDGEPAPTRGRRLVIGARGRGGAPHPLRRHRSDRRVRRRRRAGLLGRRAHR